MHRKDKLCGTCIDFVERAKAREAEIEQRTDVVAMFFKERDYALPYLFNEPKVNGERVLQHLFWNLAQLVSEPTTDSPDDGDQRDYYAPETVARREAVTIWPFRQNDRVGEFRTVRAIRPEVAAAVKALFVAVRDALDGAHREGTEEGRSLIAQLASGAITSDKFNDIALRMDGGSS